VHLFCLGLSFLAEAQPRLETKRGQKALFDRGVHKKMNYKAKNIIGKIRNLFCINTVFIVFFISLPTKREIHYYYRFCQFRC
jgi:hypothetical protein